MWVYDSPAESHWQDETDSVNLVRLCQIPQNARNAMRDLRLVDGGDGHDIACKIDGIGAINLKSEFVRKAWLAGVSINFESRTAAPTSLGEARANHGNIQSCRIAIAV